MKNAIRISVKKPCLEKFENFSKTSDGGYCESCQEEVIDFTSMSSIELQSYFNAANTKTCGRFKTSQLKTYETMKTNINSNRLFSRGIAIMGFSLLSLCAVSNVQAQDIASNSQMEQTEISAEQSTMVLGRIARAIEAYTVTGT